MGKASLDTVRKAANKLLSSKYSDTGEYGTESESKYPKGVMSQGEVESTIRKALDILGHHKERRHVGEDAHASGIA